MSISAYVLCAAQDEKAEGPLATPAPEAVGEVLTLESEQYNTGFLNGELSRVPKQKSRLKRRRLCLFGKVFLVPMGSPFYGSKHSSFSWVFNFNLFVWCGGATQDEKAEGPLATPAPEAAGEVLTLESLGRSKQCNASRRVESHTRRKQKSRLTCRHLCPLGKVFFDGLTILWQQAFHFSRGLLFLCGVQRRMRKPGTRRPLQLQRRGKS